MDRRERERRNRRRRRARNQRAALAVMILVVLVLIVVLTVASIGLRRRIRTNRQRTESLNSAISQEKERTKSIESMRDALSTDSGIGDLAREKLGLVDSDEVVFREKES